MAKKDPADALLDEARAAAALNAPFYRVPPHAYFVQRHENLVLVAARPELVRETIAKGVEVGSLKVGPGDPTLAEPDQQQHYLLCEAVALLHHVSETVLRLYLAHEDVPACPWLELARLRQHERFKKSVKRRFLERGDPSERGESVAQVFFGSASIPLTPRPPTEKIEAAKTNIQNWLRFFASEFLDQARLYNSVKHGLAIETGPTTVQLLPAEASVATIGRSGLAVTYLERRDTPEGARWSRTTTWIELDAVLAATLLGIRFMAAIWNIGRARYTGQTPTSVSLFDEPSYEDFRLSRSEAARGQVTAFSLDLPYFERPPGGTEKSA